MKALRTLKIVTAVLLLAAASGCSTISDLLVEATTPPVTETPTPTVTPTPGVLGVDTPISLQLWVPPDFDPEGSSLAAQMLRARLDEYSQLHPGIRVVTRVKASSGPSSMIESLSAAVMAAPLALPDLVLLSGQETRIAAERSLIYAFQSEVDLSEGNDWYSFAADLATIQEQTWGLPFAADVMVLVYRQNLTPEPPSTWDSFIDGGQRLVFPAADPRAEFTLLQYLSESGQDVGELTQISWVASALERVLNFYDLAQASNLMPYWLTSLDSDAAAWDSFLETQGELGISWMSAYLQDAPDTVAAARVPTRDGQPISLAKGWVWAVATPNSERQSAAEDLAVFLTEASFAGSWAEAAGFLPPRPGGLSVWMSGANQSLAGLILPNAQALPRDMVLTTIGPPLQQAAVAILKQELSVNEAAVEALNQLEQVNP